MKNDDNLKFDIIDIELDSLCIGFVFGIIYTLSTWEGSAGVFIDLLTILFNIGGCGLIALLISIVITAIAKARFDSRSGKTFILVTFFIICIIGTYIFTKVR